ncbi:hypothetical protein HDU88_003969 [Geranomyces variabilis]|nr:hypothetical protein HDU88_003969 [Geranomyces variabilis]
MQNPHPTLTWNLPSLCLFFNPESKGLRNKQKSMTEIDYMQEPDACSMPTYNVDAIGIFGGCDAELYFLEQSGAPDAAERPHLLDDSVKLANETISATKARLREFLDAPVDEAKKKTRALPDRQSAPFGWSDVDLFHDVMELLLCPGARNYGAASQETLPSRKRKGRGAPRLTEICTTVLAAVGSGDKGEGPYTSYVESAFDEKMPNEQ